MSEFRFDGEELFCDAIPPGDWGPKLRALFPDVTDDSDVYLWIMEEFDGTFKYIVEIGDDDYYIELDEGEDISD